MTNHDTITFWAIVALIIVFMIWDYKNPPKPPTT